MAEGPNRTETGEDLYAVLGVPRDADSDAIRKAYRKLARKYHPDVNPGDEAAEERFKAASRAYAVLSDPEKRRNYDEFGEVSLQSGFDPDEARRMRDAFGARFGDGGPRARRGAPPPGFEEFSFGDLDDLLGRAFGGRAGGPGAAGGMRFPGPDLRTEIRLDFLTAALGGERRIDFARPTSDGGMRRETLTVRIPPGVSDGGEIRLAGKGGEGVGGGPSGDLYCTVRVDPHPVFRREGRDLHLDLPLSVPEATLGTKVSVPTLSGRVTLTVPPATDSGRRLRVKGKGIPHPHGGAAGDLYATVQIRVPRDLDDEAKAGVEALRRFDPADLRKEIE